MGRIMLMGEWLSVIPSTVNVTKVWFQEWRDSLFLGYGIDPTDLPEHCDECVREFDIFNTLNCKTGNLITAHQNVLHYGVSDLASKAFIPRYMRDDPKIYTGCGILGWYGNLKGSPSQDVGELKQYLLIRDLWT